VVAIVSMFAATEVGATINPAECPGGYANLGDGDPSNDICFGNCQCDPGEALNECVYTGNEQKQVLEISPTGLGGVGFGQPVSGSTRRFTYYLCNNASDRRSKILQIVLAWPACPIPLDGEIAPEGGSSLVGPRDPGDGAYAFAVDNYQSVAVELNFETINPGVSAVIGFDAGPTSMGEMSAALNMQNSDDPVGFSHGILGPGCVGVTPTLLSTVHSVTTTVGGGCEIAIDEGPPATWTVVSGDCNVTRGKVGQLRLAGEEIIKLQPGQWIITAMSPECSYYPTPWGEYIKVCPCGSSPLPPCE